MSEAAVDRAESIAWLAGIVEGEGCIHVRSNGRVELKVKMADRDVVERVMLVAGCGNVTQENDPRPYHSNTWVWRASEGWEVVHLLRTIRPWLGERRGAKADEALGRLLELGRVR